MTKVSDYDKYVIELRDAKYQTCYVTQVTGKFYPMEFETTPNIRLAATFRDTEYAKTIMSRLLGVPGSTMAVVSMGLAILVKTPVLVQGEACEACRACTR